MALNYSSRTQSPSSHGLFSPALPRPFSPSEDGQDAGPYKGSEQPGPRKSVKYLTCWYWQNGGCKKTEDECLYSHCNTGIQADRPRPVRPGGPVVAGKNALQHDEQEKVQRSSEPPGLDLSAGYAPMHNTPLSRGYFDSVAAEISPLSLAQPGRDGRILRPPPGFSDTPRRVRPQEEYRSPPRQDEMAYEMTHEIGAGMHPDDPFYAFRDIIGPPLAIHPNQRARSSPGEHLAVGYPRFGTSQGHSYGTPRGTSYGNPHGTSHGTSHGNPPGNPHGNPHGDSHSNASTELECVTATAAILGDAVQKHLIELYEIRKELHHFTVPSNEADHPMILLQAKMDRSFLELNERFKVARRELKGTRSYEAVFADTTNPWSDRFRYRDRGSQRASSQNAPW